MPEFQIDSLDDPRLEPYRDLKKTNRTRWSGDFIAEGIRVVERLLDSDFPVNSVFITHEQRHRFPPDLGTRTTVFAVPQSLAEVVVGYRFHAGVLACGQRKENPALGAFFPQQQARSLIVGCPRTTDPDNLGNIIRIAAAFGAGGLLVGTSTADPFSRRTLRVSMGNAFQFPIRTADNFAADLQQLREEQGYQVIASCLSDTAIPLSEVPHSPRQVLLLGNESDGLEQEYLKLADVQAMIPMALGVDSLNVSVATGIFLYELTKVLPI